MFQSMRRAQVVKLLLRGGLPITIMALCATALAPHITHQLLLSIPAQLGAISGSAWMGAIIFTLISLWTIGRYDGVAHQHFATRVPPHQARLAGTISIALAQTLGFGIFTGALARWRILTSLSLKNSLQLSAFVSVSFMICWAIFTAFICLTFQGPKWATLPSIAVVFLTPLALFAMFRWPNLSIKSLRFHFPNLQSSAAILFWTVIDTTAVGAAMFMLLPAVAEISFSVFLPLFLLALGAALFSNTPGGVGPFELMMLGLLQI